MRQSKYTRELLEQAVAASVSIAGVLRYLAVPWSGGMHSHISRRIKQFEIDTSHFLGQGHRLAQASSDRLPPERILVARPQGSCRVKAYLLRRALIEAGVPYVCAVCLLEGDWQGQPLVLHVDHIDGNYLDSRRENLRFLCPNCHTQTASWAGRNKNMRSYRSTRAVDHPSPAHAIPTLFEPGSDAAAH